MLNDMKIEVYSKVLCRDPKFTRFSDRDMALIVEAGERYGEKMAEETAAKFGPPSGDAWVMALPERLGCSVELSTEHMPGRFAEYDGRKRLISCFLSSIETAEELLEGSPFTGGYSLCSLCVAHECFHHLEELYGRTPELAEIELPSLFGRRCYRPPCASEVAAHMFVQTLLSLPRSPAEIEAWCSKQ